MDSIESVPGIFGVGRIEPTGVTPLGTAFSIAPNRFATTFHVTGGDDSNLVVVAPKVKGTQLADYQDTSDKTAQLIEVTIVAVDPVRDLAILEFEGSGAPVYALTGTDVVLPGAPVVTLGFPHFDQGRFVLTRQDSHVGARVLIDSGGVKSKHIVLNVQTRPGQSGSPVFLEGFAAVVAMVVGSYAPTSEGGIRLGNIDPQTLHQTTHAISAEYLSEMK